jgi:hypothetical protein
MRSALANFSALGVATGSKVVAPSSTTPATVETGASRLEVVANRLPLPPSL